MSPKNSDQAATIGDAIAQILTTRAGANLTDDIAAQITELATGINSHYTDGNIGGTYTVTFTDKGANLELTDEPWFNSLPGDPNSASDQEEVDEHEHTAPAAPRGAQPSPSFVVSCAFADRTPISFTNELVMSAGHVLWQKSVAVQA